MVSGLAVRVLGARVVEQGGDLVVADLGEVLVVELNSHEQRRSLEADGVVGEVTTVVLLYLTISKN